MLSSSAQLNALSDRSDSFAAAGVSLARPFDQSRQRGLVETRGSSMRASRASQKASDFAPRHARRSWWLRWLSAPFVRLFAAEFARPSSARSAREFGFALFSSRERTRAISNRRHTHTHTRTRIAQSHSSTNAKKKNA